MKDKRMYPLKLSKIYKEKPWGGRDFGRIFGHNLPGQTPVGESWETSVHANGVSTVLEGGFAGMKLSDLISSRREEILGSAAARDDILPILIKFLDVHDRLSIQVHPDDQYAMEHEGESGKSESWYIISASPDAKVVLGMKEGVSKERYLQNLSENRFDDMFNTVSVSQGDFFNITPGTIHGTLDGSVVIYEIQQNSDVTYRIYDYDRADLDGRKRELHCEKAADVIDFGVRTVISHFDTRIFDAYAGGSRALLSQNRYYTLHEIFVDDLMELIALPAFCIITSAGGNGALIHNGTEYTIAAGDTWFIPAGLSLTVRGDLHLLLATV